MTANWLDDWSQVAGGWERDTPWGQRASVSWDGFLRCLLPSGSPTEVPLTPLTAPRNCTTLRVLAAANRWIALWARTESAR